MDIAPIVCDAEIEHIDGVKVLADANRDIFGFITRPAFYEALQGKQLIVALRNHDVIGFLRYHHRKRDKQTTLYDICVTAEARGQGVGQCMLDLLLDRCRSHCRDKVVLKCPVLLTANSFYARNGFVCTGTLEGKQRQINVWQKTLGL